MESYQDWVTSYRAETIWQSTDWATGPFSTAHFHITIYAQALTSSEQISVGMHWGSADHSSSVSSYEYIAADGVYTYEFEAGKCTIATQGITIGDYVSIAYAVTVTYVPQA